MVPLILEIYGSCGTGWIVATFKWRVSNNHEMSPVAAFTNMV